MTLLADLEEFVCDHRRHGQMTGDATAPAWNSYLLTVTCLCSVIFERLVTLEDAELDLLEVCVPELRGRRQPILGRAVYRPDPVHGLSAPPAGARSSARAAAESSVQS
jgi:hypothetical protein